MFTKKSANSADVVIVGGGFTGLVIGELLSNEGLRCRILEAGPALRNSGAVRDAASLQQLPNPARWESHLVGVSELAASLPDARPRIRAVGGRSLVWGGWSERFDASALADARSVGAPWPVSLEGLTPFYRTIERLLTVRSQPGAFSGIKKTLGLDVRAPRIARDGQRLRTALSLKRARRNVITEATVRRLLFRESHVCGVEYWNSESRLEQLNASVVVLCASPEETIRILLTEPPSSLADRAHLLGRGLVDHLMLSYMAKVPAPAGRAAHGTAAFVPRFVNTTRATRRQYTGGFSLEVHGPTSAGALNDSWLRMLQIDKKQARDTSTWTVTAMGDAIPHRKRFIDLHQSATDSLGRPVPVNHQYTSHNDCLMVADMKQTVLDVIDALTPPGSTIIELRDPLKHRGLFHESGGCRMGENPKTSVTDAMARVRGVRGVYVGDTSVLPTSGDRHPTLTLLALAARTARDVLRASKVGFESL